MAIGPLTLTDGGGFTFREAGPGTHDLYAKASTFLRRRWLGSLTLSGTPVTGVNLVLTNGDVNGDNRIDVSDFLNLASHYEVEPVTDVRADLNGDRRVNIDDFLILAANYERVGD